MEQGLVKKETLVAIGNSIRAKNGTQDTYTPAEMPSAIDAIQAGGGDNEPTAEELTVTGDCGYRFANGGWDWVLNKYGKMITTNNISNCESMFQNTKSIKEIPFELNFNPSNKINCDHMFENSRVSQIPVFHNCKVDKLMAMFQNCLAVSFPENFEKGFDFSAIDNATSPYSNSQSKMFFNMRNLRKLPMGFLQHGNPYARNSSSYYYFSDNYNLDEIIDLPNPYYKAKWTANGFGEYNGFVRRCAHLKDITFAPNMTNGEPNHPQWSNQLIELDSSIGYYIFNENPEGLPAEKEIKDDATYQQFKNDNDSWTKLQEYSRYNHDSAVRTINSLPDTSAFIASNGGTNTIKFAGDNGSKTDGGAISTLTPEEIAVATAKGWTVSLV